MNIWAIIGVVFTAVGAIIAAMQSMFLKAEKKGANNQRIEDIRQRISLHDNKSIDCEKRFTQLEERKIDNKSMEDIRTDIMYIKGSLNAVFSGSSVGVLIQSKSPVSLTDIGKLLAKKMDIETRISDSWSKIYDFLENNLDSKNAYDIQQFCIETASVFPERFFSDKDVEFIKNFAYSEGRPLVYYGGMIGVMIRDEYFKHKDIDVDEIDKYDPYKH